jgi:choline dehydrogenase-like flavoprotein
MPTPDYDIVIVGSGAGGGTLAYALKDTGARVLIIERGDFLPQEPENWSPHALHIERRYETDELWQDEKGKTFTPGVNYYVGGSTKFYGAALPRFRPIDFTETEHADGTSPAWPFSYEEIEPYYDEAERLYLVHGADDDPQFRRRRPFPFPPVPHEPAMQHIVDRVRALGLTPSSLPLGIDLRPDGRCIRCATCDGYPCRIHAKADADVVCVRPALASSNVEIAVRTHARRILMDDSGRRAVGVEVIRDGETSVVHARVVVASCGAINSAALLLRSASAGHPHGVGNNSDALGRYYMVHNNSGMLAMHPLRRAEPVVFPKTLYVNDFYTRGTPDHPYPLGQIQMIGKVRGETLTRFRPGAPRAFLDYVARRTVDWWLFSEDLPFRHNRITVAPSGRIQMEWTPNNLKAHAVLTREAKKMARALGFPLVFTERTGIGFNSHQAGTVRAGRDPATSVLDENCRVHDVENLFVVDAGFFPSLPAMNPVLTIAANALRVAPHIAATAVH